MHDSSLFISNPVLIFQDLFGAQGRLTGIILTFATFLTSWDRNFCDSRFPNSEFNRESLNFQHSLCLDNVTQRSNRQAQKYNSQSCNPRMNERVREFSFPRLSSSWRCYTVVAGESVTGARILREILWWRARPAQRFLTQRLDNNSFERVVSARLMVYERKRKG